MFVRTAPQAELKKRKGLKTFTAEDGEQVPHEALKDAKVVVHAESYYPYQKDISLRLADAKDPEGPLTGSVMLKAEPDGVCEYADDFEVDALAEANDSLTEIGLPTIPTKYTLVKVRIWPTPALERSIGRFQMFRDTSGRRRARSSSREAPARRPPSRTNFKARPKNTVFPTFWENFCRVTLRRTPDSDRRPLPALTRNRSPARRGRSRSTPRLPRSSRLSTGTPP